MDNPLVDSTNLESIPPSLRRGIKKLLVIPTEVRSTILPHADLTLFELADFKLPPQKAPIINDVVYLSDKEPSDLSEAMLQKLHYLPMLGTDLLGEQERAWPQGIALCPYNHQCPISEGGIKPIAR